MFRKTSTEKLENLAFIGGLLTVMGICAVVANYSPWWLVVALIGAMLCVPYGHRCFFK